MRTRLLLLLAVNAAVLAWPAMALGHAELDTATPGSGDEVVGSPAEIVLTFTQDLDMSRTTMELRNAAGDVVADGAVLGDGPRELRLALPALPPGDYQVRWVSFSAEDSELERGRYSFTILAAPSPSPAATAAPTTAAPTTAASAAPTVSATAAPTPAATAVPAPGDDGGIAALLPIGIAVVAVVGIGAWLLRRR